MGVIIAISIGASVAVRRQDGERNYGGREHRRGSELTVRDSPVRETRPAGRYRNQRIRTSLFPFYSRFPQSSLSLAALDLPFHLSLVTFPFYQSDSERLIFQ